MADKRDEPELRLDIDEHRLDAEWIDQPRQYHRWAVAAADARLKVDEAKAKLDVTKAEVESDIRAEPEKYGLAKTTEAAIASAVLAQPEYKLAVKRLAKMRHEEAIANAAVSALDHRKRALEKLVDLHGRDYFASPRTDSESMEAAAKRSVRGGGRKRDDD